MRYTAIFAPASGRAATAAWLAAIFGDGSSGAERNLAVALVGPGGSPWFGGCATVDEDAANALGAGFAGATVVLSDTLNEDDPGAPARWWLAQAETAGLTRPAASPMD